MRRGDVRLALLVALLEGPAHGYELIQRLEAKTEGRWRPSPGSVYPHLQLLADEAMGTSTETDGRRVFELTEEGTARANAFVNSEGYPWAGVQRGEAALRDALSLLDAARQIGRSGSPEMVEQACGVLTDARRRLYQLLAEA